MAQPYHSITTDSHDTAFLHVPSLDDDMLLMEDVWSCLVGNGNEGDGTQDGNSRKESTSSTSHPFPSNASLDLLLSSCNYSSQSNSPAPTSSSSTTASTQDDKLRPLAEFARSFLALSVFHMADIWKITPEGNLANITTVLRQDVNASSPSGSSDWVAIEYLNSIVPVLPGDGCVGKAYSTRLPVWETNNGVNMNLAMIDFHRVQLMSKVGIHSVFSMPVKVTEEDVAVLSFYSMNVIPKNEQFISFMQTTIQTLPNHNADSSNTTDVTTVNVNLPVSKKMKIEADTDLTNAVLSPTTNTTTTASSSSGPMLSQTKSVLTARIFNVYNPITPSNNNNVNNNVSPASNCNNVNITPTVIPTLSNSIAVPTNSNSNGNNCSNSISTGITSDSMLCQTACIGFLPEQTSLDQDNDGNSSKTCRIQGCNEPICSILDTTTSAITTSDSNISAPQENPHATLAMSSASSRKPYTYCLKHNVTPRLCEHDTCNKRAQGNTRFCIAHGGGRRCTYPGCDRGARDKFFCAGHGGGKRCSIPNCGKSAVGGSNMCTGHGGGKRCEHSSGCSKSAQAGTKFCVKHGGGRKCVVQGCEKVARGRTSHCAAHGGGVRCRMDGCNRVAIGRRQLCRAHGQQQQQEQQQQSASFAPIVKNALPDVVVSASNADTSEQTTGASLGFLL